MRSYLCLAGLQSGHIKLIRKQVFSCIFKMNKMPKLYDESLSVFNADYSH